MSLRFDEPLWLVLALLAAPCAVLALRWLNAMSKARAWSAVVLRGALLLLLAAAIAGAASVRTTDRVAVIAAVDTSESIRRLAGGAGAGPAGATTAEADWLAKAIAGRKPDDLIGVVSFDGRSMALAAPRAAEPGDLPLDVRAAEGTNIEQALRLASALFPPGASRRIVLLSDGNETAGDALAAARELAKGAGKAAIDVVPIPYNVAREAMIESVDAPPQAASEATVTVRVTLSATEATRGTLRLTREGEPVPIGPGGAGGRRVEFGPGVRTELIPVRLGPGRVHRFKAAFEPDTTESGAPVGDTLLSNNTGEAFTVSPGRGVALLVDGANKGRGPQRPLAAALAAAGVQTTVIAPEELPADPLSLQAYDVIFLENVSADEAPREAQALLRDYVHDMGGGLVMVGGPDTFGAGGWKGSPLESILPVKLDLPEQLIVPSAAIMIVLDNSGSMRRRPQGSMRTQQEIANEGAAQAVRSLDRQDLVGVIAFNSMHETVVPLGPNADPVTTSEKIRAIAPGGGTNMYPAILEAGNVLRAATAQVKHVIALTDGISQGEREEGIAIVEAMRASGITVSTIAVGDDADVATLAALAVAGGGQHYRVTDPNTLPRIFLKETRVVRRPLIRESPFTPRDLASGSPLILGLPPGMPALNGLVLTQRRDPREGGAGVVNALATPQGEPLLSHWNVGLGQVAAFTSDASRWAERWLAWPGFGQMWAQIARSIARPPMSRQFDLAMEIEGETIVLRLEAADDAGRPLDLLSIPGIVYGPDGARTGVRLTQVGPGSYAARMPGAAVGSGAYVAALTPRAGDKSLSPVVAGVSKSAGSELRRLRSNIALLRQIADETGGRTLDLQRPELADLFRRDGMAPSEASLPLWRVLLLWSVAVLVLDIATRRVAWDRLLPAAPTGDLQELASAARETAGAAAAAVRRARSRGETVAAMPADRRPAPMTSVRAPRPADRRKVASPPVVAPSEPASPGEPSGLLAAKRRAQRRLQGDDPTPGDGA